MLLNDILQLVVLLDNYTTTSIWLFTTITVNAIAFDDISCVRRLISDIINF